MRAEISSNPRWTSARFCDANVPDRPIRDEVLRVHHDCHGADLLADGAATQQRIDEQQAPESLATVALVHGKAPDQDRRHGFVAWQPLGERSG